MFRNFFTSNVSIGCEYACRGGVSDVPCSTWIPMQNDRCEFEASALRGVEDAAPYNP